LLNALREFENVDEGNLEDWLQSDACEPGFRYITDSYIISIATERGELEENAEGESEEKGTSDHVSNGQFK
jgi:hypothetical protein